MKTIRTEPRSQVEIHAANFLLDCDDDIENLHELFLAATPDVDAIRTALKNLLVNFDEYLEG